MITKIKDSQAAELIAMIVLFLMAIGTVFVFSASANVSQDIDLHRFYNYPEFRQILFFPLAIVVLYVSSFFNYRWFRLSENLFKSPIVYLLIVSVFLLVLVLIPGIGTEVNNARRWLRLGVGPATISFQPSEFAKWVTLFFVAGYCEKYRESLQLYKERFLPVCAVAGVVVLLIIKEDFGTAAFISLLTFLILIIGGVKFWHVLTPLPLAATAFFVVIFTSPARMQRIKAFLNPESLAGSAAYQANQSLIALGSGGLFGKGIGKGICKYGHLPEDTTDFIFAIIGEELGLAGAVVIIVLFIVFVLLGILVVSRCKDWFGKLLATGIVMAVGIQAAINIGVVTVVLPTKGIPLPFVSAGGTSMLLGAAAVGVLINIAKQSAKEPVELIPPVELIEQMSQAESIGQSALRPEAVETTKDDARPVEYVNPIKQTEQVEPEQKEETQ
jgi:cell division protein FtsW